MRISSPTRIVPLATTLTRMPPRPARSREEPLALIQAANIAARCANALSAHHNGTDPELESNQIVEFDAPRHDIPAQRCWFEPKLLDQLDADERELLVAPLRVAPVAEPRGVAVANNARASLDLD